MEPQDIIQNAQQLLQESQRLAERARELAEAAQVAAPAAAPEVAAAAGHGSLFLMLLTVFALACFVGYYVVWRVTPALHSPLMSVTNAVSSVIIVGALIAASPAGGEFLFSAILGFLAVILASVNIFGGFIVTQRMLHMYQKKK
ncbi:MAG: NAD(P) transhydrogenase subunit alpha part 2 [Alphaproteobacteria bacterium]|jgi:NAD(P) transhydrogenase subunit alpha|nr:NAD(P) transhydrogenase subunit alpha part 2 [Alphaproteobacteria bacterium]